MVFSLNTSLAVILPPKLVSGIIRPLQAVLIWIGLRTLQGPTFAAYPVTAQPLVQTLRAMGTRQSQMLRVFLLQGALFGLGGSLLGGLAGYGLVGAFNSFGPKLFYIPLV